MVWELSDEKRMRFTICDAATIRQGHKYFIQQVHEEHEIFSKSILSVRGALRGQSRSVNFVDALSPRPPSINVLTPRPPGFVVWGPFHTEQNI